jgi:5-keto 4-deoxyuronate isomerase
LRRHLAAFGKFAHFGGHHGKAFAVFARACRFDGGVQGQQVGLVGDVVDDADFLGNLFHGRDGGGHGFAAFAGLARGLAGHAVGDLGVLGVLRNGGGHLLDRGAGFLDAGGLFAGGLRQGLRRDADLLGGVGQRVSGLQHFGDDARHFAHGLVHHVAQFAQVALVVAVDVQGQITMRDCAHDAAHFVDGHDHGFERVVDAFDDFAEVALVLRRVGAHREFAFHRGLRQAVGVGHQRAHGADDVHQALGQHVVVAAHFDRHRQVAARNGLRRRRLLVGGLDAGVEVVLDGVEVAVVGVGDGLGDIAQGDQLHVLGRDVQRADHGVQRVVDALHHFAEVALVLAGVGTGGQLALHRRLRQQAGIRHQRVDRVDAGVEVVLERVEVAIVAVGDLGRNRAARDIVHVFGSHVQGANHSVQRVVDALHHLAEVALVLGGVGTRGQLALHRRLGQQRRVAHQRVDRIDAGVEVVLERVEVAVVAVGDLGRNVATRDVVHVLGGHVEWPDHRVQRVVDALHDLAVVALVLGRIGAGGQLALHRRLGQQVGIGHHALHGGLHGAHGAGQGANLVGAVVVDVDAEVASGHLVGHVDQLLGRGRDAARDQPAQAQAQQCRQHAQHQQQALGGAGHGLGLLAHALHQLALEVRQLGQGSHVSDLGAGQLTAEQGSSILAPPIVQGLDEAVLLRHVVGAGGVDLPQVGPALIGLDVTLQLVEGVHDDLALLGNLLELALRRHALEDVGVAQAPRSGVDGVVEVAGQHGLGERVARHLADGAVEVGNAQGADGRDQHQEQQRDTKADGQAGADFEVSKHSYSPFCSCQAPAGHPLHLAVFVVPVVQAGRADGLLDQRGHVQDQRHLAAA